MMDHTKIRGNRRLYINCLIILFTISGCVLSFTARDGDALSARGFASLKYFTVDSNILAGIASLEFVLQTVKGGSKRSTEVFKFATASAVGITFLTVLLLLGPLYGYRNLYHRANFWFHLVIPVICITEFVVFDSEEITLRECLWCPAVVLIYGTFYIINLFASGFENGDWYGFVKWGFAIGLMIFIGICLI